MYGLAYVLIPKSFSSLQAELDQALAPFMRGGDDAFPREKLAFDDATEALKCLHRATFRYDGHLSFVGDEFGSSWHLNILALREHLSACSLDAFEGTFAEIEPGFDRFVRRFTRYAACDLATGRYGRWLNPIGHWDWWELGGRFNGAITGDTRPAGLEQTISSGPSAGRAVMGNLTIALGASAVDEQAQIEANVELVESLNAAAENSDDYRLPTALVLPVGCCSDEDRWFDRIEWHEISPGARRFLGVPRDADFARLVLAAYQRFSDYAAAGIAYHF